MTKRRLIKFFAGGLTMTLFLSWFSVSAAAMNSANYKIQEDSINVGGAENSSSTNYKLSDTIGEIATGGSASASYKISAGYRQMNEVYLAISVAGPISLAPNIGGLSGGAASGSGTWTVNTDSPAGYNLSIKAGASPAMLSGANSFADYTPASAGAPDYAWSIGAANSEFGFSPYNANSQASRFKHDGSNNCNSGTSITDGQCWYNLAVSDLIIADSASRTSPSGEDTKVNFQAEVNTSNGFQVEGDYSATVTITAASN